MKLLNRKRRLILNILRYSADKKYVIRNPFSEELRINGHKQDIKIFDEEGFTFIEFKNKKYLAEITDKSQNKYTVLLNGLRVATSIPQNSWPNGLGVSARRSGCPRRKAFASVPSVSTTSTWTRTSPSPGSGRGTSSTRRSPGPWYMSALTG